VRTVAEYNSAIGPGEFDPQRRRRQAQRADFIRTSPIGAYPIEKPPYFAYPMTSAIWFYLWAAFAPTPMRGVVTGNGVPLPGLYAAGEIVGLFLSRYPAGTSGLALFDVR